MSDLGPVLTLVATFALAWRLRPRLTRSASAVPTPHSDERRSKLPHLSWHVPVQRRQARLVARTYPDFIDALVLTVRAGCTPLQAFEMLSLSVAAPVGGALHEVVHRVACGDRFADALAELPRRIGSLGQPLADALAMSDRYGTPLPAILNRLADDARATRRRNAEAAARQLPVRLSFPLVGCTLPSFVLLTIVPLMAGTISSLQGLGR